MSEEQNPLIEKIRNGDSSALLEFIEEKRLPLLAFIERNQSDALKRKIEAQDILQEVTLSAVNSFETMDLSERDPFSWLCQLAERRIIDAHRKYVAAQKRSAQKEVALGAPAGDSDQGGLIDILVASMTSPSKAFSRGQREFRMLEALESLGDEARTALQLRYIQGLSSKDIAEQMDKTDGAVRVLLTRSLAKLQKILSEDNLFQSFVQRDEGER
ncbi:MAG: sigma-70 family RNA polymerase sigma factor [Planctomycetaceae bacterium]